MDCIFNKFIPNSTETRIILRPTSKTFINGISPTYDTEYPPQLKNYITEREYAYAINKIVDELTMMWPCCFCFTYGYLLSICTIGLSFIFPYCCISEAKIKLLETIKEVNNNILNKKNLQISYQEKCSTSWLQIDIIDPLLKSISEENENSKINNIRINNEKDNQTYLIRNQLN